ncbi:hypothetical protein [Reichenbachiella faecimaris]|uniref:hypothetical protein n=1 Tax=Reichenbachiella faecimaris TaxID=692418 RepID=UPI00111BDA35|nr:hypothetical protein [Reichenbachiella faecimaris]
MRSKLNFFTSILTASLLTIIMGGLSTMMILVSLKMVEDGKSDTLFKTPIYAAIVFVGLLIWVIWIYLNNCKTVILSNKGLHIKSVMGSTFYLWSEVKFVSLLDKHYLYGSAMEATTIKFKNGKVYHFMPFYYSNADYLRRCLSKVNLSLTTNSIDFETLKNRNSRSLQKIDYSGMKKIGGNPVFSFNGIFFIQFWVL